MFAFYGSLSVCQHAPAAESRADVGIFPVFFSVCVGGETLRARFTLARMHRLRMCRALLVSEHKMKRIKCDCVIR